MNNMQFKNKTYNNKYKIAKCLKKILLQVASPREYNVIKSGKLFVNFSKIAKIYEANEAIKESENCKLQQITAK